MSDWFESELGITTKPYCKNCGEGDSDWCDDCDGCAYRGCMTCTCDPYCSSCGKGDSDWCSDCEVCQYCDGHCSCCECDDCC